MGGKHSEFFTYFKMLMVYGLIALRKYLDEICIILEIMSE